MAGGHRWIVDVDPGKFVDRVNHDLLMAKPDQRIGDKRMPGLIRRCLDAGILTDGAAPERHGGTPQGGFSRRRGPGCCSTR